MAVEPVVTSPDQRLNTLLPWPDWKVTVEGEEKHEAGTNKVQTSAAAKRLTLTVIAAAYVSV